MCYVLVTKRGPTIPGSARRCMGSVWARGFSLTELMLVVAIAAVVAAMAGPSFARSLAQSRVADASTDLFGSLIQTRSEALKRGGRVVMCVSDSHLQCSDGGGWERGWVVFDDRDGDGQRDADEAVLRVGEPRPAPITIVGNGAVADYVSYVASGRTQLLDGGLLMGTLTVCADGVGREIIINHAGRPRIREMSC